MDVRPPIHERSTHDLLSMAVDEAGWTPEARALARVELQQRGVALEEVADLEGQVKAATLAEHHQRERNAQESYSFGQLLGLFCVAPVLLLGRIVALKLPLPFRLGLTRLDRDNYKRKYRQRMAIFVLWIVLVGLLLAR